MTKIASGNQEFVNSLMDNTNRKINAKQVTFYRTYSGLRSTYVTIANGSSSIAKPDLKCSFSKSYCTDLNK